MIFAMRTDFELGATGTFREATEAEAIAQDIDHFLVERKVLGRAMIEGLTADVRAGIIGLLADHPFVRTVDLVEGAADHAANQFTVYVFVNGDPAPIEVTAPGL